MKLSPSLSFGKVDPAFVQGSATQKREVNHRWRVWNAV